MTHHPQRFVRMLKRVPAALRVRSSQSSTSGESVLCQTSSLSDRTNTNLPSPGAWQCFRDSGRQTSHPRKAAANPRVPESRPLILLRSISTRPCSGRRRWSSRTRRRVRSGPAAPRTCWLTFSGSPIPSRSFGTASASTCILL